MATASAAQLKSAADIVIRPDLGRFDHWKTGSAASIRAEGLRTGLAAIVDIRRAIDPSGAVRAAAR